jgi:hypothetical protein
MCNSSRYLFVFIILIFASCSSKNEQPLFELMEKTGIDFNNQVEDGKKENSFLFRNFYNGGGVAIGDINNDGLADVFLTSNNAANKLYLNKGNFQFEDISTKAGIIVDDIWNTGVVMADINADGWLDIYVCSSGHMPTGNRLNKLYINNQNGTFTEDAKKYGLDIKAYTTQVSFFDYDMDGDLDCFMINNSPIPVNQLEFSNKRDLLESKWPVGDFLKGGGDHLFQNNNGRFTEVTQDAGIHGTLLSFGMGVSVGDINNDGYPDVYVANDSYERDYLYINQKNGKFKDMLEEKMQHTSFSSMGADIADVNNDGYSDIFTTDMLPLSDYRIKTTGAFDDIDMFNRKIGAGFYYHYVKNCLQLNSPSGNFKDIGNYSGVSASDWSWGALMFDMDNDGWNDILACNGVNHDVTDLDFMNFFANDVIQKMILTGKKDEVDQVLKQIPKTPIPNKVYRNEHNLKFTDIGDKWGLGQNTFSNGAAYGDLDNDGDLDIIINNQNQPSFVYKNNSRQLNQNNYIGVQLKGEGKNTYAVGSKIQLFIGDQVLTKEVIPSRGFQSSVDYKQIIGIGKFAKIDSMHIIWPNRIVSNINNPAINKVYSYTQTQTGQILQEVGIEKNTLLSKVNTSFTKHQENDVIDFYAERGLPEMLSKEGPKAAVADVNGDLLEDVFIGGTPNHPGQLYLQDKAGNFTIQTQKGFEAFKSFEDVAVQLVDIDNDKDVDLIIGPGGNNNEPNTRELQIRLFKNDGKGNFEIDATAFPNVSMNISVIAPYDFNKDGFIDLFVGARNYPFVYGMNPTSFLFQNDGKGHFVDIAPSKVPAISSIGMVTDAKWVDIDGDQSSDLVIVGEWMSPQIFKNNKGQLKALPSNLNELNGWWQTIAFADVNSDGKQDLIMGNIGENFYLQPSKQNPVKLFVNDFDKNGIKDKVVTYTVDGKDKPVVVKRELEEMVPSIKKNNLKHIEYAKKSIQEIFSPEDIKSSIVKTFDFATSIIAINKGGGKFDIMPLPAMTQLSSVNAIQVTDLNRDGKVDFIIGGNHFDYQPQYDRLDGSFVDVLLQTKKGQFEALDPLKAGILLKGQMRDIKKINRQGKEHFLFLQNNDYPVLYQLNSIK